MSVPDIDKWDKGREAKGGLMAAFSGISRDFVLLALMFLTGTLCFGLGLTAGRENRTQGDTLWIEELPKEAFPGETPVTPSDSEVSKPVSTQPAAVGAAFSTTGTYMASKSGSKYYLPSCSSAKRIKEENRVWFATKDEAEKAGYSPGANCKGL